MDFSPYLVPLKEPDGAKWGQILFLARSSPFLQWRDLFASFEQWQSQILEKFSFRPHLASPRESNGGQMGPIPIFCPIFTISQWRDLFASLEQWQNQIFKKIGFKSPFGPTKGAKWGQMGPNGAKWGQILFFAQSSPFSQWRDLFASFEQWQSQILEKLDLSPLLASLKDPLLASLKEPIGAKSYFLPNLHHFIERGPFCKFRTMAKSNLGKIGF